MFSVGDSVSSADLAKTLEIDEKALDQAVSEMEQMYNDENRGIRIVKLEKAYQLCTKNEYYDILSKLINIPKKHKLTDTLLETLSIVAYLIREVGRLDAIGRPILFGTTEDFLRSFGVSSMDELPIITPDKIEDFRQQAMEEVNIKVEV